MGTTAILRHILFNRRRTFGKSEEGSFALKFALAIVPLLLSAGMAVEVTRIQSAQTKLQNAADAAALAARLSLSEHPNSWRKIGEKAFLENAANVDLKGKTNIFFANPEQDVVTVQVKGKLEPKFAQIFGYPRLDVGVSSTVKASDGAQYLSVVFLIDHSYSMGIGADDSYISTMANASGCAFSCHYNDAGFPATFTRNDNAGAKLRIDVVRRGLHQVIDEFEANLNDPQLLEVSAYAYGNELKQIMAPTSNFTDMRDGVDQVGLKKDIDLLGTNLRQIMIDLSRSLPPSGDGSSPSNRKSIIVLLTDGIEDNTYTTSSFVSGDTVTNWPSNPEFEFNKTHWNDMQVLDRNFCRPLKKFNHEIIPIQIEYVIPKKGVPGFERPNLDHIEDNLLDLTSKRAKACATGEQYYEVKKSSEIRAALDDIAKTLTASTDLYVSR